MLLHLGNRDAQYTIGEVGRHTLLVDSRWEAEGAGEFSNRPLRDPVLLLGLRSLLLGVVVLGDLGRSAVGLSLLGLLIRDGGLVGVGGVLLLAALGNGAAHLDALDQTGGWCAGCVGALSASADDNGLRLRELDADVILLDAGELAVELVGVFCLLHVELGAEGAGNLALALAAALRVGLATVVIEVVEESEERGERGLRGEV